MNRAERRQQHNRDKTILSRGLDVSSRDGRQIAALMRLLHDWLSICISKKSVSPMMQFLHSNMDASINRFRSVSVACRRGCSHCCHMWVDASAPELLYIAKLLPDNQRAAATLKLQATCEKTQGMSFDERGKFVCACPMLAEGNCSAYATRPLVCRAAASIDAAICERAYIGLADEEIPLPLPYMLMGSGYRLALAGAVRRAGLHYRAIEMNSGLSLAISDDAAEASWLSGGNPFALAQKPPVDDVFDNPDYEFIYTAAFD